MREIKFRAWDKKHNFMINADDIHPKVMQELITGEGKVLEIHESHSYAGTDVTYDDISDERVLMQFTGLHDKNGKEIFEGDIVRVRQADRFEETHVGDNIPLGSYTELLEPYVKEWNQVVTFKDGMFGLDKGDDDWFTPLIWLIEEVQVEEYELCDIFRGRESYWEEDLDYLLQEYTLSSAEELIKYLGIEVIGNRFENPELLEQTT